MRYNYQVSSSISVLFFWMSCMILFLTVASGAHSFKPYSDKLSEIDFLISLILSISLTLRK